MLFHQTSACDLSYTDLTDNEQDCLLSCR